MNIKALKELIANLPDDMAVVAFNGEYYVTPYVRTGKAYHNFDVCLEDDDEYNDELRIGQSQIILMIQPS